VPALIAAAGERALSRFLEFASMPINDRSGC
jgi:hypothetical protein